MSKVVEKGYRWQGGPRPTSPVARMIPPPRQRELLHWADHTDPLQIITVQGFEIVSDGCGFSFLPSGITRLPGAPELVEKLSCYYCNSKDAEDCGVGYVRVGEHNLDPHLDFPGSEVELPSILDGRCSKTGPTCSAQNYLLRTADYCDSETVNLSGK